MVSKAKIQADKITQEGNYYSVNTTFFKTMMLFSDNLIYVVNSKLNDMNATSFNAWDCNTIDEYCHVIKNLKGTFNNLL